MILESDRFIIPRIDRAWFSSWCDAIRFVSS
jgi:hypothetical protein